MSYIDLLNEFNRWLESNTLPAGSQLLYYKLLHVFNRAGWPEHVQLDNLQLMVLTKIRNMTAVIHARDQLVEAGFISFIKGKKGEPNRYTLIKERQSAAKNDPENETEIDPENDTENESVFATASDKHNKNKTKTKTKTKNTTKNKTKNISPFADDQGEYRPAQRTEKPFARLTEAEVRQYVADQGYMVDACRFVSYYDSVGWRVGSAPMRDWKAAVRTWQMKERSRPSERYGQKDIPKGASGSLGAAEMEAIQRVLADSG